MKRAMMILTLMLFSLSATADSPADKMMSSDIVKKTSPYSVNETMDKFEAIIKNKGLGIFARIDHRKNAQGAEMDMNEAQVLIFGNPKAGTAVMKQDVAAALDLPMRVAVYEDKDGKVYLAYHAPDGLAASYELKDNPVLAKLTEALDKMTSAAIAE